MMTEYTHQSVLLDEALTGLAIKPDGIYIDGTFGRGGHSRAILARLNMAGRLIAIDKDPQAITFAGKTFGQDKRFSIHHASFSQLQQIAEQESVAGKVDGILFDLGISSPQVDDASRGFSFLQDGPLDMRMNPEQGISAAHWINSAKETVLADVFYNYGEERYSRRIARAIVNERTQAAILTTGRLADIVSRAHPRWEKHKHPATRVFQAIRIFINNELEELKLALVQGVENLAPSGRLAVISFHSLEDRIVKRFFRDEMRDDLPIGLPIAHKEVRSRLRSLSRAIKSSAAEIEANPRSRSAVLRLVEKMI